MTNAWTDIKNTDLVVIMGGNAAEVHPCGFKWVTEAKANRGARLIVVDSRFTRSASVADYYCPIRQGTDIAFLLGVINQCIQNNKVQWEYVKAFTNAPYLVKEGFEYRDGLFTGYDQIKRDYDKSTWEYELGPDGYVISDETLQHPRCVWSLLKKHATRPRWSSASAARRRTSSFAWRFGLLRMLDECDRTRKCRLQRTAQQSRGCFRQPPPRARQRHVPQQPSHDRRVDRAVRVLHQQRLSRNEVRRDRIGMFGVPAGNIAIIVSTRC